MISVQIFKKWFRMLTGKSNLYVNQNEGQFFEADSIKGYYNNLSEKVDYTTDIDENGVPWSVLSNGSDKKKIYFPIAVFQYGLGAYDKYLETKDEQYKDLMISAADWATENQKQNGAWDTFSNHGYDCPYSSMAQGEGASLLSRAYCETGNKKYYDCAINAVNFMLTDVCSGGTAEKTEKGLLLYEYPGKPLVLNGWIFSAFGLYDVWLLSGDPKYCESWNEAVRGIKNYLSKFNSSVWSYYDLGGKYTSSFYHSLHIELLKALNKLSYDDEFSAFIDKWTAYKNSRFCRWFAFVKKAFQKLTEKKTATWFLVN